MIEILLKNKECLTFQAISDMSPSKLDFHLMQFHDSTDDELDWLSENYGLDFTIMKNYEDIEISSHFLENATQASFHFSIPYLNREKKMVEEPVFIIVTKDGVFLFSSCNLDTVFNDAYSQKVKSIRESSSTESILKFQFEFISDYFADITESQSRKIKTLSSRILIEKEFSKEDLDIITTYNFNNLLIKEALLETSRIFNLYMKSNWEETVGIKKSVSVELNDLSAVSDYIQFNFDRLDDLKENVANKIDLEQNYIFKMLTVVTVCISLPTFIAGVYGMNFETMPELEYTYGYPIALVAMILSALLPFIYFKKKKWLKQ